MRIAFFAVLRKDIFRISLYNIPVGKSITPRKIKAASDIFRIFPEYSDNIIDKTDGL